jgi:hypothetical protein
MLMEKPLDLTNVMDNLCEGQLFSIQEDINTTICVEINRIILETVMMAAGLE